MSGSAYFLGYLAGTITIVGILPIIIGGFYPFGKRATSNRTAIAWIIAAAFGFFSLNGGTGLIPVALALAIVAVFYFINRTRPARA